MHPYRDAPQDNQYTPGELAWFRKPLVVLALVLGGCVRLAHVDPQPRDRFDRTRAAVTVISKCSDGLFAGEDRVGSGVVISERHVLTAAHVVRCHVIPRVYILTSDGNRHRAYVTREDDDVDIARLEIAHAGRFGLDIAPPMLAPDWEWHHGELCAYPPDEPPTCGERTDYDLFEARMEHGDSGAGVYDREYLVGLVIRDWPLRGATRVAIVDLTWLEGT